MTGTVNPAQVDLDSADWVLIKSDPETGHSLWELDLGNGRAIHREEFFAEQALVDANTESFNDSDGKRWGDGRIVGSIPLNVYFEQLAEANRQHDDAYVRKWLNDSKNSHWRTFKGNL